MDPMSTFRFRQGEFRMTLGRSSLAQFANLDLTASFFSFSFFGVFLIASGVSSKNRDDHSLFGSNNELN